MRGALKRLVAGSFSRLTVRCWPILLKKSVFSNYQKADW